MKNYIMTSILLVVCILAPELCLSQQEAQKTEILDTIYANDTKNVALFFPEPIRQGIIGSENFVFTYNREKEQYFGLLQAKPGDESNLLVINRNGTIFSYIVKYKEELSKLNYFISFSKNIGNEIPRIKDSIIAEGSQSVIDNNTFYYQKFCTYLLERERFFGYFTKRKNRIILSIENIVYDKEQLYFVIQIKNNSTLDYDLNFLNIAIETRQKGKRKSLQRLYLKPIFKYNTPSKIVENELVKFVYVMPKFSISNDRRVILDLNEKDGERNIELKISHKFINNPN